MQQKGAVEMAADSQEMAFFVRTDRTEKSRPVVTLLLLLLLSNGADGGTKRKKLQAQYFRPEDAHRAKCNAAECQR